MIPTVLKPKETAVHMLKGVQEVIAVLVILEDRFLFVFSDSNMADCTVLFDAGIATGRMNIRRQVLC
jgi:hypothetical protein